MRSRKMMYKPEFLAKVKELVDKARKPTNKIAENALRHIEMADKIKAIDPNMAALRMITAEEEAATAIMLALKSRKYVGADKLKHKDHVHKLGIFAFMKGMKIVFKDIVDDTVSFGIRIMEFNGKEIVRTKLSKKEGDEITEAYPIPPLNFVLSKGENGKPHSFEKELSQFATESGSKSIKEYIEEQAFIRHALLYATEKGIANVVPSDEVFENRKERVINMLCVYLMIDPYHEKQLFVQNCLLQYLKVLDLLPKELESLF